MRRGHIEFVGVAAPPSPSHLHTVKLAFIAAAVSIAAFAIPLPEAYAKPCYSTVQPGSPAAFKCVTNRGLLTNQERLLLNPNSSLQGASIKAIPGESKLSFQRRLVAARKTFKAQF